MFSEEERQIFPYFNGEQQVFGDPLLIQRKLFAACDGDPNRVLRESEVSEDPGTQDAAKDKLYAAIRLAFKMAPFDGTSGKGATEAHCDKALDALLEFVSKKKASTEPLPMSSPSMASQPDSSSITDPFAACGATSPESA